MKKLLILTFFTILTFFILVSTYGIFESGLLQGASIKIAAWEVTINDSIITDEEKTFTIDNIIWNGSENVLNGKVAPGMDGYFDIVIDPNNTGVSVRYDIVYDIDHLNKINTAFKVIKVEELNGNTLVLTDEYTYTGIMNLEDINSKTKHIIRTYVKWEDMADNGQNDYLVGTSNTEFEIPIDIHVIQYLGEEIKEYVGEN